MTLSWFSDYLLERKILQARKSFERTRKRNEFEEFQRLLKLRSPRQAEKLNPKPREIKRHSGLGGGANT